MGMGAPDVDFRYEQPATRWSSPSASACVKPLRRCPPACFRWAIPANRSKFRRASRPARKSACRRPAPGSGDVYLKVTVEPDPNFERDGDNLTTTTTIDVFTALLGGEADVQTLTGRVKLTIPPGTQPEQKFRLAGRGMPKLKDPQSKGDLFVKVKVTLPRQLTEEQKRLLERVRDLARPS